MGKFNTLHFVVTSLLGFVLVLSGMTSTAWAGEDTEKVVTTTGECFRKVEPDRGSLYIGVEVTTKDADGAAKTASRTYERIRETVKKMNLKDFELSTSGLSVTRVEEWGGSMVSGNKPTFKGYRASMGLDVTTSEISRLGEVAAKASDLGANSIGGLVIGLSRDRQTEEERACLESAVKDAKAKATAMVGALGQKLGRAVQIIEGGNSGGGPRTFRAEAAGGYAKMAQSAPLVESKPLEISISIQASFKLD